MSRSDEGKRVDAPEALSGASHTPRSVAAPAGTTAQPSFLPPDASDAGDSFLERLAPSLRPEQAAPPSTPAAANDAELAKAQPPFETPAPAGPESGIRATPAPSSEAAAASSDAATSGKPAHGLISNILAREMRSDLPDDGAHTALRTLPFRLRRTTETGAREASSPRARAELLRHLAERSEGIRRSQLLVAEADLLAQIARSVPVPADAAQLTQRANDARRLADELDPTGLTALRRRQARALRGRQRDRLRELYAAELELPVGAAERSLAACALAEMDAARGADDAAVLANLQLAIDADPTALVPNLLRARLELRAGKRRDAAASLRRAAETRSDAPVRALLFMEAGRASERAPDSDAALAAYAQALTADSKLLGAALGRYRAHRASGTPGPAVHALETLEQATPDPRLRNEFARKRARLLREVMGNARAATIALAETTSLPGLREKLRAAEAAGDTDTARATLQRWAEAASGAERGLALLELATLHAKAGARGEALEAIHEALLSRAPQGLVTVTRALVSQQRESQQPQAAATPRRVPSAPPEGNAAEALRAAARLARDPQAVSEEREALSRIAPTDPERVLAELLGFDAAAEMSDLSALQAGLLRELVRLPLARRPGPALALLSLTPGVHDELGTQLANALHGSPLVGRFMASRKTGAAAAQLWLDEAAAASGEQAAFAAVMAGHALRVAGADSIDAFAEALDHVRGYPPACFALELPARRKREFAVLERVHRELATTSEARGERAGRRARLGLLSADSDLNHAIAWFELASEDRPNDPLTADLRLRLDAASGAHDHPARLALIARLESDPKFARAYQLRAAAAFETSGLWGEAAGIYRTLLDNAAEDRFARAGLWHALRQSHAWDALAVELERESQVNEPAYALGAIFEEWAEVEARRGDAAREKAQLERLLEIRPNSLFALRGLSRAAMTERDDARLLALTEASLSALDHEAERAAALRLCVRLRERLGRRDGDALLLANAGSLFANANLAANPHAVPTGELWFSLALEAIAIRRRDHAHYYELTREIAALLHDPVERAAYALRAAETLELTAPARALADLEPLLLAAPEHPLALTTLARLNRTGSTPDAAAAVFMRAAEQAREPERAVELFHTAGVLFDDEVCDDARATAALSRAAEIDITYADTFNRLRRLLRTRGEPGALLALLGQRASAPIEPELAAELELERAELFRSVGDRVAAQAALRAALTHDPARTDALRALADLLWDEGEYHKAAEALVQVARLTDDKTALSEVVFQLGSLYDEHLRDPRRAELAFTRSATLAPDDPRPIERLVQLWKRTGQKERAMRALQHLIANSWSVQTKEGYILELASTLEEMGERALAEQALEDARQKAPISMRVLRAQASLYEREGDRTALSLHLQRSCNALRAAIDDEPGDTDHWLHLIELLERRDRPDGAELVIDAAYSCGLTLPDRPRPHIAGLGARALADGVLRKIVTRGLLDPLRRLFREFHADIAEYLPAQYDSTESLPESQTRAVRQVAELFGLSGVRLLAADENVCVPVAADPLTLCMGEELFLSASEAERYFLLARAVVVAKHGLILLVRAAPERVLLVLHALRTVVRPGHAVQVANEREQRSVTRELAKRLPPPRRTQLRPLLSDLLASEDFSARRMVTAAYEFGARVSLAITGDLPAAIDALLRLRGAPPEGIDQLERLRLLRSDPALRALLSFAISEAYLDARREIAAPPGK